MHDCRVFEPEHFILKCRQVPIHPGRCAAINSMKPVIIPYNFRSPIWFLSFASAVVRSRLRVGPLIVRRIARNALDRTTFYQSARGLTHLQVSPSPILTFRHRGSLDYLDTAVLY